MNYGNLNNQQTKLLNPQFIIFSIFLIISFHSNRIWSFSVIFSINVHCSTVFAMAIVFNRTMNGHFHICVHFYLWLASKKNSLWLALGQVFSGSNCRLQTVYEWDRCPLPILQHSVFKVLTIQQQQLGVDIATDGNCWLFCYSLFAICYTYSWTNINWIYLAFVVAHRK